MPAGLEGVDPSFLEALPESIRREVIAEQLRLARVQNQVRENAAAAATTSTASTTAASTTSSSTVVTTAPSTSAQSAAPSTSAAVPASLADVSAEFLAALPPAIQEEVLMSLLYGTTMLIFCKLEVLQR